VALTSDKALVIYAVMGIKKGSRRSWTAGRARISRDERLVPVTISVLESQAAWLRGQPNQAAALRKMIERARADQDKP
jgi:hypothetical protein